jgi:hypothetical protein
MQRQRKHNHGIVYALAAVAVGFLWLGLSASHEMFKFTESIRGYLPSWFGFANLVLAPVLMWLRTGPSSIGLGLRLVSVSAALVSMSALYLSWERYPVATVLVVAAIYFEVFWLIPKLDSRRSKTALRSQDRPSSQGNGG